MIRSLRTILRPLAILALAAVLATAAAAAAGPDPHARNLLGALRRQLATSRLDSALTTARAYVAIDPTSPDMFYNLAGLEEHAGHRDAAAAALKVAVDLGFDDFRLADADSDLGDLRTDPRYGALREQWQRNLRERCAGRSVALTAGAFGDPIELSDRGGGLTPPLVTVRLRYDGGGFEVEATVQDLGASERLPAWRGGSGLAVTFLVPSADAACEGTMFREVGAGLAKGLPEGVLLLPRPSLRWQPVAELTPKLHYAPASKALVLDLRIPWQAIAPLDPLAYPELAINVSWISRDAEGHRTHAALLDDPATFVATDTWRRGLPLRVAWSPTTEPRAALHVSDHVVTGSTVAGTIGLVAPVAGRASLTASLENADGQPIAGAIMDGERAVVAGWQQLPLRLAATALPLGPVTMTGSVTLPGGQDASFRADLLALPTDWLAQARRTVPKLPESERASVALRLDAITGELAARQPGDPAGALATTVRETESLLQHWRETGTTIPDSGAYLAILPAAAGVDARPCSVNLPPDYRNHDGLRVLVVIVRAFGQEDRFAQMAQAVLAERGPGLGLDPHGMVVVVPHVSATDGATIEAGIAQAADWVTHTFPGRPLLVAGVDDLAAPTLRASLAGTFTASGVLLMVGEDFMPWPGADAGRLRTEIGPGSLRTPYAWIRFPADACPGDQCQAVIAAMKAAGFGTSAVQDVPGSLSLSQAWGRAMLWAAGSR